MTKKEQKQYLISKLSTLNVDQRQLFDEMQRNIKLTLSVPTGFGKGYLMMVDLLNQIISTKNDIFAISSHRLMLNNQHLNDIFKVLSPLLGDIGFIFVGSVKYDSAKFLDNVEYNKALLKKKTSYIEIISSTTSMSEVDAEVERHINAGRKVVLLTTYHSMHALKHLDISTIYNDEAHTLASEEEETKFKDNFSTIRTKRCLFLTATPKDCYDEETSAFLMNNKDIFGERVGLTFRQAVDSGYVVRPVIHIATPSNYAIDVDFNSTKNRIIFVQECFLAHKTFIETHSIDASKIAPKILVKCSSVDDMWALHKDLVGKIDNVKICAGASRNDNSNSNHFIDNVEIRNRNEYLQSIQGFEDTQMAIVLHYDILSEGINVSGFTGTMFLTGKLPTITKTLQNTGRSTRLHSIDRDKIMSGEISASDYSTWVKPYCAVIIPYWDSQSEFTKVELAKQIKSLRDNFGYDPVYYVSIGSDIASGKKPEDMDGLNKKKVKDRKTEIIDEITHEIELMDKEEIDLKEMNRIDNMSMEEWFNFANGIK